MSELTEKQIVRALKRLNDNWNDKYTITVAEDGGGRGLALIITPDQSDEDFFTGDVKTTETIAICSKISALVS